MNKDPFEEGRQAAAKDIPAESNPYKDGSDQHERWATGHQSVAGAIEASQSEGT